MFAVIFEDVVDSAAIRSAHMEAHLSFLEKHASSIDSAGPLIDSDAEVAAGLWLVKLDTFGEVETLVEADPFWAAGLRKSVEIRRWRRVFRNSQRV